MTKNFNEEYLAAKKNNENILIGQTWYNPNAFTFQQLLGKHNEWRGVTSRAALRRGTAYNRNGVAVTVSIPE